MKPSNQDVIFAQWYDPDQRNRVKFRNRQPLLSTNFCKGIKLIH